MQIGRNLILWLCLALACTAASAQAAAHAGTYRAQAGSMALLIRATGTRLDIVEAGSTRSLSVATLAGAKGISGVLPNGDLISLGDVFGRPHLLIGTRLLPLTPVAAAEFSLALARTDQTAAPTTPASAGPAGSLAGMSLVYARSKNGYGQMRRYDFCSDGSFFYRFEELQSSQLGNAAGERTDSGTWRIEGQTLQLQFRGRGPASFNLQTRSSDSVALDGVSYGAERSRRCR